MATIGTFTHDGENLVGFIITLALNTEAVIQSVAKRGENAPDYRVYSTAGAEIGAGWSKQSKTDNKPYIQLKLDDPSFADAILCRLVSGKDGNYALVWSR